MTKFRWPERQGNIDAIILVEEGDEEYGVFIQTTTHGPWFEGSRFERALCYEVASIDNHHFVYRHNVDGNGSSHYEIVGIAHSELELPNRIYECAVSYCKKRAKVSNAKFIDQTSHAKIN